MGETWLKLFPEVLYGFIHQISGGLLTFKAHHILNLFIAKPLVETIVDNLSLPWTEPGNRLIQLGDFFGTQLPVNQLGFVRQGKLKTHRQDLKGLPFPRPVGQLLDQFSLQAFEEVEFYGICGAKMSPSFPKLHK